MHYGDFQEAMLFIMVLATTYAFAVFAALFVELPFAKLVALVFMGGSDRGGARDRAEIKGKATPSRGGSEKETPLLSKA